MVSYQKRERKIRRLHHNQGNGGELVGPGDKTALRAPIRASLRGVLLALLVVALRSGISFNWDPFCFALVVACALPRTKARLSLLASSPQSLLASSPQCLLASSPPCLLASSSFSKQVPTTPEAVPDQSLEVTLAWKMEKIPGDTPIPVR